MSRAEEEANDIYYEDFMDRYPELRTPDLIAMLKEHMGPELTPTVLRTTLQVFREDLQRWTDDAAEDPDHDPDDIEANLDELAVLDRRLKALRP